MKRIISHIICIALCVALTIPISYVAADSSGKVGEPAVFNASGTGSSQTGSSDTDTDISTGGSDASTDSTADKQNKETNQVLKKTVETITGKKLNTSVISNGGNYVWVESMLVPVNTLQNFLDQADYVKGAKYEKTNTSDRSANSVALTAEQQSIMDQVVNGQIESVKLEDGGTKASNNNMASFDMSGANLSLSWPSMTPNMDPTTLQSFKEYLLEHGYTIPGTGGQTWIDFEHNFDRYEYIKEYMHSASITDTVNVQHIIEYSVSNVTEKTLYREQQIEYPGGGYYHWDISCLEADDPAAVGKTTSVRTPTGVLVTQFGTAGVYQITAKENVARSYVSTVTYDIQEYWILADTGQVIYKKISNGGIGDVNSASGRFNDNNTVYYNYEIEYNYGGGDDSSVAGEVIYDTRHTVTADMLEGVFPAVGVYSNNYNTVRIQ